MTRRQDRDERFSMHGSDLDSVDFFDRQTEKSHIQGSILNHSDLLAGENISQREFDAGVELKKSPYQCWHDLLSSRGYKSNADAAEPARSRPLGLLASGLQLFQGNGRVRSEDSSGLGEGSALTVPIQ